MAKNLKYWYLGTEYTKYPQGIEAAYEMACQQAAQLLKHGIITFCPIAHSHGISLKEGLDSIDGAFWAMADEPFLHNAYGLIVVMTPTWRTSSGLEHEIREFQLAFKPIRFKIPESPAILETIPRGY